MTDTPLARLERQRDELYAQMAGLGDFRRGSVNETFRRCGKPNCACVGEDHRGHGPRYLWTRSVGGRTRSRQLAAAEVDVVRRQVAAYQRFTSLSEQIVEVNEQICQARPVGTVSADRRAGSGGEKGALRPVERRSAGRVGR